MYVLFVIVISLLLLEPAWSSTRKCNNQNPVPTKSQIQNFQTNIIKIANDQDFGIGNQFQYYYNVPLSDDIPKIQYQVTASLPHVRDYYDQFGIDYLVKAFPKIGYFILAVIMAEGAQWKSVDVFYVVSGRSDIFTGDFMVDGSLLLLSRQTQYQSLDKLTLTKKVKITQSIATNYNLKSNTNLKNSKLNIPQINGCFPFISGISVKKSDISSIQFQNTPGLQFKQSLSDINLTLTLTIIFSSQNPLISSLRIGYIVYQKNNKLFQVDKATQFLQSDIQPADFINYENKFYATQGITVVRASNIYLQNYLYGNLYGLYGNLGGNRDRLRMQFLTQGIQFKIYNSNDNVGLMPALMQIKNQYSQFACVNYKQCIEMGCTVIEQSPKTTPTKYTTNTITQKKCLICPINSKFNTSPLKLRCECIQGYYKDKFSKCSPLSNLCQNQQIFYMGKCIDRKSVQQSTNQGGNNGNVDRVNFMNFKFNNIDYNINKIMNNINRNGLRGRGLF